MSNDQYDNTQDNVSSGLFLDHIAIHITATQHILLSDVTKHIANGDVLGILGASGCGKSTLLHYICGFGDHEAMQYHGNIILNGNNVTHTPAWQRKIAMMFQDDLLYPHLNIGDNLAMAIPKHVPKKERAEQVRWALEECQLPDFARRDPTSLSGGQRQRVAMMRCLLSQPDAMLLDEPFSKLDKTLRAQFRDFVGDHLKKANIPAILVSHDHDDLTITQDHMML